MIWIASSGTTNPNVKKFIGLTPAALMESANAVIQHLALSKQDRIFNPLPIHHVGGLGTWVRAQMANCFWFDGSGRKWNPETFVKILSKNKITSTSLVPTQVYDLVQAGLKPNPDLRHVVVGGGRLLEELYFQARTLGWPLLPSYGMTEHASQIATADLKSLTQNSYPELRWLNHVEAIEAHSTRDGQNRAFIRSKSACARIRIEKPSGEVQLEDPRSPYGIRVEDQLEWDSKRRTLRVVGRRAHEIKIFGELVNVEQVEVAFSKFAPHLNFAIHEVKDPRSEHALVLYVEGIQNFLKWDEAVTKYNAQIEGFKRLWRIEFLEQLPRNDLGKIIKSRLSPSI